MGMGMATLVSTTGKPAMVVGNVEGVRVSGILFQAGTVRSESLFQVGEAGHAGLHENPTVLNDIFARVGGPDAEDAEVFTDVMVQVNSGNVITDNNWLWRADHDVQGTVGGSRNKVNTSLQINGDNHIGYSTMCEHALGNMLVWNGDNGRNYFFQSEYPYDVDVDYATGGFVGYKVNENVTKHEAWGTGIYSFFRDHPVLMPTGISAPKKEGILFHNSFGRWLYGQPGSGVTHIIDEQGEVVNGTTYMKYQCEWKGSDYANTTAPEQLKFLQN
jgi:hypothetical protein